MNFNYSRADFYGDLKAGIIVSVLLIPQAMAYAMLAGLPPVMGLYAATFPLIVYAFFASSKHLSVGPVAIVSLLVASSVSTIEHPGTNQYVAIVILLSLLIGILQVTLGIFRFGQIIEVLPHSVISGFITGAAILIGWSQFENLLQIKVERNQSLLLQFKQVLLNLGDIHLQTLLLSMVSIVLLIVCKRYTKLPGPLVILTLTTSVVWLFRLDLSGIHIIGDVPKSLPHLSIPDLQPNLIPTLLPMALTIAIIGYMESIAVAKTLAAKSRYSISANRELVALGLANMSTAFIHSFSIAGAISRSAVNYESGAKTKMATLVTALVVIFALVVFTPFFYYLPVAVLSSIIVVAVLTLIDFKYGFRLLKTKKSDGSVFFLTFFGTLSLGLEEGLILGICFSLLLFISRVIYLNSSWSSKRFRN
ncbi:SulP family inorganic anion transporter [Ammoniphilus sp. YIM 78166]|uniref:SulP family inorganic anion transporter n=1 Tax=Ammoniphilus sp. YIM 78166 TaxID=1644106 RepID=UPI0010700F2F|nr:SulP family inorganic anion transporter [Ammoniphilus sp. YIM 78166]